MTELLGVRSGQREGCSPHSVVARTTAVYAACHFAVDLACVSTLTGWVVPALGIQSPSLSVLAVLVYDAVAFCLQLPLGALLDALGRRVSQRAALFSFALVALGVACGWAGSVMAGEMLLVASVALVAVGNALFHCAGGVEVLAESDGRMAPSGEFISTGALGVFVGGLAGFNGWWGTPVLLIALLVGCAVLVVCTLGEPSKAGGTLALPSSCRAWPAVALLAATVALRSYVGMVMAFPWKASLPLAVLAIVAVVAGKAVGGRLADEIGAPAASVVSLGGAVLLFLPSWESVPAGLAATLLFNFTMAITLGSLARLLPRAQGMAFGIASFSLAIGALPALMGLGVGSGVTLATLSLVSLVLLELALMLMARVEGEYGCDA